MNEADILAMTYEDTCTVYRPQKEVLPSGETVLRKGTDGRKVYEDAPCALSSPSRGSWKRSPSIASVDTDYTLFVRPEVNIHPGDTVLVLQCGKTIHTMAGLAARYPSHNRVPLKRLKEETQDEQ